MNVHDFKIWFDGLVANTSSSGTLEAHQLRALKEKVKQLEDPDDPLNKPKSDSGSGSPDRKIVDDTEKWIDRAEKERQTRDPNYPSYDPFPTWTPGTPWIDHPYPPPIVWLSGDTEDLRDFFIRSRPEPH